VKRAALLLVLLTGGCAATPTPTRDELAHALRGYGVVEPTDLTHIACKGFPEEPTEFVCRWRQRDGRQWQGWVGDFALSGAGWQTTDSPSRRP
jgi:hypothetical protein